MLIIHTSDWHLGQSFYNYNRDDEHRHFAAHLSQIVTRHKPDALIVAGDIFDVSVPGVQAQRLLVEMMSMLHDAHRQMKIILIAGNHDSASRLDIHAPLWRLINVDIVAGVNTDNPEKSHLIKVEGDGHHVGTVIAVPYIAEYNYRRYGATVDSTENTPDKMIGKFYQKLIDSAATDNLPIIMTAHLAVAGCDSRSHDISKLSYHPLSMMGDGYDYLALGHIHHPSSFKNGTAVARYSGTPFQLSFDEDFNHSVSLVSIDRHGVAPVVTEVEIPSLRQTITFPDVPVDTESTLRLVRNMPESEGDYIRVNILSDKPIDIATRHKIEEILVDKGYRFCLVQAIPTTTVNKKQEPSKPISADIIRKTDPLEIARSYYAVKYNGQAIPDNIVKCLKEAIDSADKEMREDFD